MKYNLITGSVMGTATGVSQALTQVLVTHGHEVSLLAPFSAEALNPEHPVLIVTSNTGMGDLPASILPFYHFILRPDRPLHTLRYLLVNLGDSSYPNFGQAGHTLNDALMDVAAQPLTDMLVIDAIYDDDPNTKACDWLTQWLAQ